MKESAMVLICSSVLLGATLFCVVRWRLALADEHAKTLQTTHAELQACHDELCVLQTTHAELQACHDELKGDLKMLQRDSQDLVAGLAVSRDTLASELNELRQEHRELESECNRAKGTLRRLTELNQLQTHNFDRLSEVLRPSASSDSLF
jgi:septal ring factor EnvC (AmiA/AmiB activator)